MRLLHVSDLHLGRGLGDLSREPEQRAVVAEIVEAARELDVAMTVISGDIFDAFTPPAWAEDLFFTLLDGLAQGGARAVAVIAGNHDSGARLAAADPLARRLGIILAGDVGAPVAGFSGARDVVRVDPLSSQVARLEIPGQDRAVAIALLPFLSESRVARAMSGEALPDGATEASRYATRLAAELRARADVRVTGAYHVLAMHQYVTGGVPTESERRLRVGAISDLDASAIPAGFDYVAVGHLHRPQEIVGAGSQALYAGSPIAYSFSEAGQEKRAVLVELGARPGVRPVVSVPLSAGRPLEIWSVDGVQAARDRAASAARRPIVDVRADLGRRLAASEVEALFGLEGVTVASVRDLFLAPGAPAADESRADVAAELPVEELFRELWRRRVGGEADDDAVSELLSAVTETGRGEAPT